MRSTCGGGFRREEAGTGPIACPANLLYYYPQPSLAPETSMLAFIQSYPLLLGIALILLDLVLWQLIPLQHRAWRIGARLVLFLLFSSVLVAAGMSPLQPPPGPTMSHATCWPRYWPSAGGCSARVR